MEEAQVQAPTFKAWPIVKEAFNASVNNWRRLAEANRTATLLYFIVTLGTTFLSMPDAMTATEDQKLLDLTANSLSSLATALFVLFSIGPVLKTYFRITSPLTARNVGRRTLFTNIRLMLPMIGAAIVTGIAVGFIAGLMPTMKWLAAPIGLLGLIWVVRTGLRNSLYACFSAPAILYKNPDSIRETANHVRDLGRTQFWFVLRLVMLVSSMRGLLMLSIGIITFLFVLLGAALKLTAVGILIAVPICFYIETLAHYTSMIANTTAYRQLTGCQD